MQKAKRTLKIAITLLLALLLVVFTALSVSSASQNVQAVLDTLAMLQRANIEPWQGDVQHNEELVQDMYDNYVQCTPAERGEFTNEQLEDLRAYFEVLYAVQGKNTAALDALFEIDASASPAPSSSQSSSSSSQASSSSSQASSSSASSSSSQASSSSASSSSQSEASSQESSSSQSVASSSSSAAPSSSSASAVQSAVSAPQSSSTYGMPTMGQPPQLPNQSGLLGVFGNPGFATLIFTVLAVLAAALFICFARALSRAGRAPNGGGQTDELRAKELFGENYDAESTEETKIEALPAVQTKASTASKARKARTARQAEKNTGIVEDVLPTTEAEPKRTKSEDIVQMPGEPKLNAFFRRTKATNDERKAERQSEQNTPDVPAKQTQNTEPQKNAQPTPIRAFAQSTQKPTGAASAPPTSIGLNPEKEKANPIAMRSFSSQPRTGRPAKTTFKQGPPTDLDAIDD